MGNSKITTESTIELKKVMGELINTIEESHELISESVVDELLEVAKEKLSEIQELIFEARRERLY